MLLILPTYEACKVCLVTTAYALIAIIMLPPLLLIDWYVAVTFSTLFKGCGRIWNNKPAFSQSDVSASILGIVLGGATLFFSDSFQWKNLSPDHIYAIAAFCLIAASVLIPVTLFVLDRAAKREQICDEVEVL